MNNFVSHFTRHVITYPFWEYVSKIESLVIMLPSAEGYCQPSLLVSAFVFTLIYDPSVGSICILY